MRKLSAYIVLVVVGLIYVAGCNQTITNKIQEYKAKDNPYLNSDRYRYGDLYGMSYLSYFRKSYNPGPPIKMIECSCTPKIDLYTVSDSYIWPAFTSKKYYYGVDKLDNLISSHHEKFKINLDSAKINVLMLEFTERNVAYMLEDEGYMDNILNAPDKDKKTESASQELNPQQIQAKSPGNKLSAILASIKQFRTVIFDYIFNININSNLEFNLTDNSILSPIKELKADMNYKLFNAVDDNVKISDKGDQLFYTPTVDTLDIMSAFRFISDKEKDTLVSRLNSIYFNYKKNGFARVYLTIVPNPISMLSPNYHSLTYNHLLERIQNSPSLKMPFINLLPVFSREKNRVYLKSDSHWNHNGASIWQKEFNSRLETLLKTGSK